MHWGAGGFGMGFSGIIMPLAWIVLIGLTVYAAVRAFGPRGNAEQVPGSPLEIARARYARGEIDREEFERLQNDLAKR